MYKEKKFKVRSTEDILEDIQLARERYPYIRRVFIADGNALALSMERLIPILTSIKETFPECERIGVYGAPMDILRKTKEELKQLKELGLGIIYLGLESGSDAVLDLMKKGVNASQMIESANKVTEVGIPLSVTVISGLGGKKYTEEHANETGRVLSAMNPDYIGVLTLMTGDMAEIDDMIESGAFELLSTKEVFKELYQIMDGINVMDCMFRSNHASNYFSLAGDLPSDKSRMLKEIEAALNDEVLIKAEGLRGL
jgi:radical SAM superfamily enzyme YgiQ (UPF0313 family)